jgi:branched-chain amino acid transport system substrate-binding protein
MAAVVCTLGLALASCSSSPSSPGEPPTIRVAFLQDLTVPSHVDLVSPSFLAFDMALHGALDEQGIDLEVEVVQLDTEGDPERAVAYANEIVADPTYVAAVAAPFWTEPPEVAGILASGGLPTLSLSPQSPPPAPIAGAELAAAGLWHRFVPDRSLEVETLAEVIERAVAPDDDEGQTREPVCILGEAWSYSTDLQQDLDAALPASVARIVPPGIDLDAAIETIGRGCGIVVWTGSPDGAVELEAALPEGLQPVDLGSEAVKTVIPPTVPDHEGVVVRAVTCPCVDVSTSTASDVRRFINAYQSAHGLAPGIYAAEAWDAAHALAVPLAEGARDASEVAARFADLDAMDGVARVYRFDERGEVLDPHVDLFAATGSRWLRLRDGQWQRRSLETPRARFSRSSSRGLHSRPEARGRCSCLPPRPIVRPTVWGADHQRPGREP